MKMYPIKIVMVVTVLVVALAALAQQDDSRRQRMQRLSELGRQAREAMQQAAETIQDQAAKLKAHMEEGSKMSREEGRKIRGTRGDRNEERQKMITNLELQIEKVKGPIQLRAEHEDSMGELKVILDLAVEEKAKKTAERLEKLIEKHQTIYDDKLQKLGFKEFEDAIKEFRANR